MSDNANYAEMERSMQGEAAQSSIEKLVHEVAKVYLSDKAKLPDHRFVVAIDFGTAYSGYATYTKHGTGATYVNLTWGTSGTDSYKTPTVVLLNKNGTLRAFGEEAQKEFCTMESEEIENVLLFEKFKMMLHRAWNDNNKKLNRNVKLTASNSSQQVPAIKVIAHALRFMKESFNEHIKRSTNFNVQYEDVLWVITVPAIWNDAAKQFMREAAFDAGLMRHNDPDRLLMALEPEAAGLWCKELPLSGFVEQSAGSTITRPGPGDSYMIIDAGGGTVDIAVHSIEQTGTVRELIPPSGGPWGGEKVNEAYKETLQEIFGACFTQFAELDPSGFYEFLQTFERIKRSWKPETSMKIQVPIQLADIIRDEGKNIKDIIKAWNDKSCYDVTYKLGYLYFPFQCAKSFFDGVAEDIENHVNGLMLKQEMRDVKTIFMVGGFSACHYLQQRIRNALGSTHVILIPEGAGLSVLRGAIQFGRNPEAVRERVSKETYGVEIVEPFDRRKHDPNRKQTLSGTDYCVNVFAPYITKGDTVHINSVKFNENLHLFAAVNETAATFEADIYRSKEKDVKYTDKPGTSPAQKQTEKIGTLKVVLDPSDKKGADRPCAVAFACGHTEIQVVAVDLATGKASNNVKIDCLVDS